jgi:hypothetical protein
MYISFPLIIFLLELSSSYSGFGLGFFPRKTYSPKRPLLILTNRNKSWTHVIICDYLIGVQWLIRLLLFVLAGAVLAFNGSFDFLLSRYYLVYSLIMRTVLSTLYTIQYRVLVV